MHECLVDSPQPEDVPLFGVVCGDFRLSSGNVYGGLASVRRLGAGPPRLLVLVETNLVTPQDYAHLVPRSE